MKLSYFVIRSTSIRPSSCLSHSAFMVLAKPHISLSWYCTPDSPNSLVCDETYYRSYSFIWSCTLHTYYSFVICATNLFYLFALMHWDLHETLLTHTPLHYLMDFDRSHTLELSYQIARTQLVILANNLAHSLFLVHPNLLIHSLILIPPNRRSRSLVMVLAWSVAQSNAFFPSKTNCGWIAYKLNWYLWNDKL